jgi:hypothetical protein
VSGLDGRHLPHHPPLAEGPQALPAGLADPQRRAGVLSGGGSRTRSYTRRGQTSNHDESIKKEHE